MNTQPWFRSAFGLIAGIVALALVTALLTAAVYSYSAAGKANDISAKFNKQLDELQVNAEESDARSARAQRERADLMAQNETLQRQLRALGKFLRPHDIAAPNVAAPAPSPRAEPKPPRKPRPKPRPVKPTPTPKQPPSAFCQTFPTLCEPLEFPKVVLP